MDSSQVSSGCALRTQSIFNTNFGLSLANVLFLVNLGARLKDLHYLGCADLLGLDEGLIVHHFMPTRSVNILLNAFKGRGKRFVTDQFFVIQNDQKALLILGILRYVTFKSPLAYTHTDIRPHHYSIKILLAMFIHI